MGMLTFGSRPVVECDPDLGAQQHYKEECDINNILKKYVKTGMVTHVAANEGRYADFSEVGTYHEALQRVLGLSPEVREFFEHDPAVFLDFIIDPENLDQIQELGLEGLVEEPVATSEPSPASEEEDYIPSADADSVGS